MLSNAVYSIVAVQSLSKTTTLDLIGTASIIAFFNFKHACIPYYFIETQSSLQLRQKAFTLF